MFPAARDDAPVLFFIHGGYWRALDKRDVSFIGPSFTREGAMVVIPNYALAPTVTIEAIALQMVQALAWTWRHAALYGGNPRRIVVAGHSAGGHLAALLLTCRWTAVAKDLPADLLAGGLSISGLFDLEPIRQTPFLQPDLRLTPAAVRRLSPAYLPAPSGPLYATVGRRRERGVPAPERADPRPLGRHRGAGLRGDPRRSTICRFSTTSPIRTAGCIGWRCSCCVWRPRN